VLEHVVLVVVLEVDPFAVLDVVHPQFFLNAVDLVRLPVHDADHTVDLQIADHAHVFEGLHIAEEEVSPQQVLLVGIAINAQNVTAILLIVFLHYRHPIIYYNLSLSSCSSNIFLIPFLNG
jgi:hypothetical protein